MKKVLWFSRHDMTETQHGALVKKLGEIEVTKINATISSARELEPQILTHDVIAIVAPIGLQSEFIRLAGDRPVITALSERIVEENEVTFKFIKWERLVKIDVIKEDFA